MIDAVRASLSFMSRSERVKLVALVSFRALLGFLDLIGIAAIGFLATSAAMGLLEGSTSGRGLEIGGFRVEPVNSETLPIFVALVLLLFLTKALFSIILTKKAAFFVANVEARASREIAETSFGGDLGDARVRSREEMMYAIQSGAPSAFNTILNSANSFVTEASLFVILLVGFFFVDPIATFAAILYFGLIFLMIQFSIGSLMIRAGKINAEKSVQATIAISDLVSVFRELLVMGKRKKYVDKIYDSRVASAESMATLHYLSGMPRYIIEASLLVGVSLFILSQALSGDIVRSAGTVGVFLTGGFRLTAALLPLQNSLLAIKAAIPSAQTAYDILQLRQSSGRDKLQASYLNLNPLKSNDPIGLEFREVSFHYPGAELPALSKLSFVVEPGSQVALMGPSGAGKSTIADLMTEVLTPSSGTIFRHSAGQPSNQPLAGRVSYVPQRPGIVSGTILQNVALAVDKDEVDRESVIEALELAHLGELVQSLPEGVDTQLGKLQDGLSGGQMQRLGLARALYFKPGLLVMDEATSALDAESESEIQRALEEMRGKVTVVLIAHRLNTIQYADNVILIEDGSYVDSGTFNEIKSRNPAVQRVIDLMSVKE